MEGLRLPIAKVRERVGQSVLVQEPLRSAAARHMSRYGYMGLVPEVALQRLWEGSGDNVDLAPSPGTALLSFVVFSHCSALVAARSFIRPLLSWRVTFSKRS